MADEQRISLRPASARDAKGIARVHVDTWRTTYPGLLPEQVLSALSYQKREAQWSEFFADPAGRFLDVAVTADDRVIGFACGGASRTEDLPYDGEVYAIYIALRYQRGGIGRALLQRSMLQLRESGFASMLLWLIEGNPAAAFYERTGGKLVERRAFEIGGIQLAERSYGWDLLKMR